MPVRTSPGVAPTRRGRTYALARRRYLRTRNRRYQTIENSCQKIRSIYRGKTGDSERANQQTKSERNEETKIKIKTRKTAYKSCRVKLPGLVNYGSPK